MRSWKERQEEWFNRATKNNTIKEKMMFKRWGNAIRQFVWTIAKFLIMSKIFLTILDKMGSDKTIVLLMTILIMILITRKNEDKLFEGVA